MGHGARVIGLVVTDIDGHGPTDGVLQLEYVRYRRLVDAERRFSALLPRSAA